MTHEPVDLVRCRVCNHRPPTHPHEQLCGRCIMREGARLAEINDLYAVLPAALAANPNAVIDLTYAPYGGAASSPVRRCADCVRRGHPAWVIPCPHPKPAEDQTGDVAVAAVLHSWVKDWADNLTAVQPPTRPTVPLMTRWLRVSLPLAVRYHPAIEDYSREMRNLVLQMRKAINRDLRPTTYEAPCPWCHTPTLHREAGGDWIECADCGRLWGDDEYTNLARAALDDDQLLTTDQAALVAHVDPGRIRIWAHRGKLTQHRDDDNARPMYLKGEVVEVAERMATL